MNHRPGAAVVTMILLAVLDLVGAVVARRYVEQRSFVLLGFGCAAFAVLFVVYAHGLRYADLTTITFGWIVLLQVGVVLIDRVDRGVSLPTDRVVVMAGLVALQGYLVLAPSST